MTSAAAPIGVVVAGGRAMRMGHRDKALLPLAGKPLLAHVLDRLAPQVAAIVLSANGDLSRYARFGLPAVADAPDGGRGPLAGVLTGMRWAANHRSGAHYLLTVPCDTPFLPRDLAEALRSALRQSGAEIACATSAGRTHPLCALWPVTMASSLAAALRKTPDLGVARWMYRSRVVEVTFPVEAVDPFFNANTQEDLSAAEEMARALA